ncbi:MAG TPA: hypothetical protein VGX37_13710 [Allosphingosinicella sp.]|jgi:hypothetical protein|nr:hypothetical protein [Allosphingosinicella sp.]
MWRRPFLNRWGYRSAMPYRRPMVFYSYGATVLLVSAGALLVLYLLGYLSL